MKKWILVAALVGLSTAAQAQYGYGTGSNSRSYGNSGYQTQRGTYVQPYRATSPNNTDLDNYSTRGNVNPYTGRLAQERRATLTGGRAYLAPGFGWAQPIAV